ncbi:hypothetical protein [Polaromonas sp. LjRoot131]|uniref:hypothetical protein n=1 Tax=Polaromonas sp. LjRoot131 TaxID=3342262 RepID=UPI003ED15634
MKHHLSEDQIAYQARPFSHTGRLWGAAIAACLIVPYAIWKMPFWEFRDAVIFGIVLVPAALIGLLVVMVRRLLRPSKKYLEGMRLEIDRHGVWKEAGRKRSLLLGVRLVQSVDVYRDRLNVIQRVVIAGARCEVSVEGLADMEALVNDAQGTFPHAEVNVHRGER